MHFLLASNLPFADVTWTGLRKNLVSRKEVLASL